MKTRITARPHRERHRSHHISWLRAAVLGANDGAISHARDELGITEELTARPVQAALASAASFTVGAAVPLIAVRCFPVTYAIPGVFVMTLCELTVLGALAAKVGGAPAWIGAARVSFWGALAMAVTAGVGFLFHVAA